MKRRVLYLGSNPPGTVSLGLDEEVRAILQELRSARYRCFDVVARWTSQASDLVRELREAIPTIVHLSGHACKAGDCAAAPGTVYRDVLVDPTRDIEGGGGLVLHDGDGSVHVVSYAVVQQIFALAGSSVRLVVLTACNTAPLAALLLEHVDCVIGIDGPIGDRAALEFSKGLYAALGDGAPVDQAFLAGRLAIRCAGLPDADRPTLQVRDGVDASRVVLAVVPRRRKPRTRRTPSPALRRSRHHDGHRRARRTRRRQPRAISARSAGDSS
jgi:CHAT domain-containing protein